MFGNNFKWVKKQSPNFPHLIYCEIKLLFFKKISEKSFLKIDHTFYID